MPRADKQKDIILSPASLCWRDAVTNWRTPLSRYFKIITAMVSNKLTNRKKGIVRQAANRDSMLQSGHNKKIWRCSYARMGIDTKSCRLY